jgi:hypothetical protein
MEVEDYVGKGMLNKFNVQESSLIRLHGVTDVIMTLN